ncbi:MAG: hypothetical protein GY909_08825 [Oligoflexia bacterium]|nr:hypothetical protein [Oligoflexia bacterium]
MKKLIIIFLFLISKSVFSQELRCVAAKGIQSCKKEAVSFCEGNDFIMDSNEREFVVTCKNSSTSQNLKKEEIKKETTEKNEENQKATTRYAIYLSRIGSATYDGILKITNKSNGTNTTANQTFELEPAYGLGFELRYMRKNGWGMIAGLDYDLEREIKSKVITQNGHVYSLSPLSNKVKLTSYIVHGTILYRWEKFYLGFGLNLNYTDINGLPGADVDPSIGGQLDMGYELGNSFAVDFYIKSITYDLNFNSGNFNYDFNEGGHADSQLKLKYIF